MIDPWASMWDWMLLPSGCLVQLYHSPKPVKKIYIYSKNKYQYSFFLFFWKFTTQFGWQFTHPWHQLLRSVTLLFNSTWFISQLGILKYNIDIKLSILLKHYLEKNKDKWTNNIIDIFIKGFIWSSHTISWRRCKSSLSVQMNPWEDLYLPSSPLQIQNPS